MLLEIHRESTVYDLIKNERGSFRIEYRLHEFDEFEKRPLLAAACESSTVRPCV